MSARSIPGIVAILLAVMVAADLVGVAASFILDVAPARNKSVGLGYAIWLVLGVFAGVVAFGAASERAAGGEKRPAQERVGSARLVLAVAAVLVAGLLALFTMVFWKDGGGGGFAVVPDHMPTSIVFFASFLAACIVGYMIEADSGEPGGSTASEVDGEAGAQP